MKKTFILPWITCIAVLMFSCKKQENRAVWLESEPPGLLVSDSVITLNQAAPQHRIVHFLWQQPSYGFDAAVRYTLQFDRREGNFTTAYSVEVPAGSENLPFTTADMNDVLRALDLSPAQAQLIQARISATVSGLESQALYSESRRLRVRPSSAPGFIYVPGDYENWDMQRADSLMVSGENGVYQGIIHFQDRPGATFEFKLSPDKSGNVMYGEAGGGKIDRFGGSNFKAPGPGTYQITVDMNALELFILPFSMSVSGTAIPGSRLVDHFLEFDNGKQIWSLTTLLTRGSFKFLKNEDWSSSYGMGAEPGTLARPGADIVVGEPGAYTIELDLKADTYKLIRE